MEENKIVELTDEQGVTHTLEHLLTYANEGKHYIAFSDQDDHVLIFKITEESGKDDIYEVIDNPVELEEAWAVFKDIYYEKEETIDV